MVIPSEFNKKNSHGHMHCLSDNIGVGYEVISGIRLIYSFISKVCQS